MSLQGIGHVQAFESCVITHTYTFSVSVLHVHCACTADRGVHNYSVSILPV